jgi:predicted DNA-binding transcriptional regulator AlpA
MMSTATTAPTDTTAPTPKLLLTAREAAAVLSVSERTLWSLTWPRGPIHPVRLGRAVRYSADGLRAWVQSQQGGAQP